MQNSEVHSAGIRIRVSDLLFALQKRWMIIVALSLVGLVFGLILSAMTYVQSSFQSYEITGSFAVTSININGLYLNNALAPNNNDYHLAEDMIDAVQYVIKSDHVMNDVINDQELLGYTVSKLKNGIYLRQYNTTQIVEMSLTWRTAEEGIAIWNAIVEHASGLLPVTLQLGSLAVINEAQAELVGVGGGSNSLPVLLTILGFAAGVGFAVVELLMHPTLNNVKDVETMFGLETIGVIPRDDAYFKRKESILVQDEASSYSSIVQSFSAAAYILRNRLGTREEHHCFYVTSSTVQEGKSAVAANLAIQLSDMEHRTLLIDFDTRNPSLGALFLKKVDYARSLNALYRGEANEEEAITTLTGYLDLLPTVLEHNALTMDSNIIELVQRLSEKYEYVILDAPPVGMVSDTLSLNQVANTVLFVVGYDSSTIPEIQSSLEKLDKSGIRVLGCIVNGVQSGRNLSLTKNAEEQKKNILKKSKEKKKNKEKLSFRDADSQEDDLLEEIKSTPKPAEEGEEANAEENPQENAPQEKNAVNKRRSRREEKRAQKAQKADPADVRPMPARPRNVLDDLMEESAPKESYTDQEVVDELLRIGISNEWDRTAKQTSPNGAEGAARAEGPADKTPANAPRKANEKKNASNAKRAKK